MLRKFGADTVSRWASQLERRRWRPKIGPIGPFFRLTAEKCPYRGCLVVFISFCNEPDAPEAEGRCAFPKTDRLCSTLPDSKQVDEGSMKRQQFLMRAMEPFAIAATLACAVTPDLHWSGVF